MLSIAKQSWRHVEASIECVHRLMLSIAKQSRPRVESCIKSTYRINRIRIGDMKPIVRGYVGHDDSGIKIEYALIAYYYVRRYFRRARLKYEQKQQTRIITRNKKRSTFKKHNPTLTWISYRQKPETIRALIEWRKQ
jgi:hypothetical protein